MASFFNDTTTTKNTNVLYNDDSEEITDNYLNRDDKYKRFIYKQFGKNGLNLLSNLTLIFVLIFLIIILTTVSLFFFYLEDYDYKLAKKIKESAAVKIILP